MMLDMPNRDQSGEVRPRDIYGIDDEFPTPPELPGRIVIAPRADELIDKLAMELVLHAETCVREFGDFHLALSGGSTPEPLYRRLMYDPDFRKLPWRRTHLWIVDERCVPLDDERSNYRMIRETIVEHADIPREQVHPMSAEDPRADLAYEKELRETLGWRERGQDRLDYVLLGMGVDGHTASLFPRTEPLRERERLVRLNFAEDAEPHERITMTFPMINTARFIAVLVTGEKKAPTLERVAAGDATEEELPICGVRPREGQLVWYLDGAACGETPRSDGTAT